MMDRIENFPPARWSMVHPRLAAWIVLSVGMVAILVYEARDVGLKAGNWFALIVATVLVAGACIMIVSWEDEDDLVEGEVKAKPVEEATGDDAPVTGESPASESALESDEPAAG